jgi:hypothetical protein
MIHGWKGLAQFLGRHERTLRQYHYKKLRVCWLKDPGAHPKGGKLAITESAAMRWWHKIHELGILRVYDYTSRRKVE